MFHSSSLKENIFLTDHPPLIMKLTHIDSFISSILIYLSRQQESDGGFFFISAENGSLSPSGKEHKTILGNAALLNCLAGSGDRPEAKKLIKKLGIFLKANKSNNWSWNYWPKNTEEAKIMPYPDDLDDTFSALSGIMKSDSGLLAG